MGDIRVFPGVTFEGEMNRWTLGLVRMDGESQEAYAQRVQQVVNLALSFVPKSEPAVFDFSDTSKYRQVGPTAWEAITPGYHPTEETGEEERMHPLISRLQEANQHGQRLTEETPVNVEKLRACWKDEMRPALLALWDELVRTDEDAHFIQRQIADWENIIPDMTAWPEQSE